MSRLHHAYVAGLLDGEGYLGLVRPKTQRIYARVAVQLTVRAPLDALSADYGGPVGLGARAGNRKDIYHWVCPRGNAAVLLQSCLPYLLIKNRQAELLLDWFNTRLIGAATRGGAADPAEALYAQCKLLNARGARP